MNQIRKKPEPKPKSAKKTKSKPKPKSKITDKVHQFQNTSQSPNNYTLCNKIENSIDVLFIRFIMIIMFHGIKKMLI